MIEEHKLLKETIERRKFCDVCSTKIQMGYACMKAKCGYCGKDLCEKCIGHEESSWGDYRGEIWCKQCWDIGSEYRPVIEEMNIKIETLYNQWQEKCRLPLEPPTAERERVSEPQKAPYSGAL